MENLDIFVGESRDLTALIPIRRPTYFYGEGNGNYTPAWFSEGLDYHEAKAVDLDGDGRPDIVSKPYNFGSPRVDIFMNQGMKGSGQP